MIQGIAFTMYPVIDMKRARKFYEGDLGLKPTKEFSESFIEYHLEGNCFTLAHMDGGPTPSANMGGSVTFEVDDLNALLTQLRANGTPIKMEPMDFPACRMAVVIDPEGNAVGLHTRLGKGL